MQRDLQGIAPHFLSTKGEDARAEESAVAPPGCDGPAGTSSAGRRPCAPSPAFSWSGTSSPPRGAAPVSGAPG